ncbi:Zinc finger, RING-type [Dillenia turbinata]|uniref:Zinc finger, RING-type n=1 Tax=Dillenia turbinata TaxID=194707 RepID=A0AAN8Z5Z5_9MAGN
MGVKAITPIVPFFTFLIIFFFFFVFYNSFPNLISPTRSTISNYAILLITHLLYLLNLSLNHLPFFNRPRTDQNSPENSAHGEHNDQPFVTRHRRRRESDEHEECAVCLCRIEEEEEIRELRCKHLFHKVCLDRWAFSSYRRSTCPLCRGSLARPRIDAQLGEEVLVTCINNCAIGYEHGATNNEMHCAHFLWD